MNVSVKSCFLLLSVCAVSVIQVQADDPCPLDGPPAGTERVAMRQVMPSAIPPDLLQKVQAQMNAGYQITVAYAVQLSPPTKAYFIAYDNSQSAPDQASIRYKLAVVEKDSRGLSAWEVTQLPSGAPALGRPALAYRRQGRLYVITSFFQKGACMEGLVNKAGNRYLQVTARPFTDTSAPSEPIDYPAVERQFSTPR